MNAPAFGQWTAVDVGDHTCQLYEPPGDGELRGTILYLHDLSAEPLEDHPAITQQLDRHRLRAVCPRTGPSWWSDRICPQFDASLSAERYVLESIYPIARQMRGDLEGPVALLGIGMGGQGALRLAYKYPDQFPVVAAISPAIDYQIRIDEGDRVLKAMYGDAEAARQETATLHIHPLNWPRHQWFCCDPTDYRWHDSAERLRMKLFSLGVPHECQLEHEAGGHSWQYFEVMAQQALAFAAERLDQEERRIVN